MVLIMAARRLTTLADLYSRPFSSRGFLTTGQLRAQIPPVWSQPSCHSNLAAASRPFHLQTCMYAKRDTPVPSIKRTEVHESFSPKALQEASEWVAKFKIDDIPLDQFTVAFARSSGPGGQNVNKVSTKVDMRFTPSTALWIPEYTRAQLITQMGNRLNRLGELCVASDQHRTQRENKADCVARIYEMIRGASAVPGVTPEKQKRRVVSLEKRSDNSRLDLKKVQKDKKQSRQYRSGDDDWD